jgi:hypothetical protein
MEKKIKIDSKSKKEIEDEVRDMMEGARLIDEMRKDGRLPPDYNMDGSVLREIRAIVDSDRKKNIRSSSQGVVQRQGAVQSMNHNTEFGGKDTSALGFQVRAAMYNAGNNSGRPYHPLMVNGAIANFEMDLMDQAGVPYNIASPWEEL